MEERLISMSWWEKRSFHARKRSAELMRTPRSGPEHQKIMKADERKRKAPGGSEESGETAWESMRSPWKSMKLVTARMKRAGMMRARCQRPWDSMRRTPSGARGMAKAGGVDGESWWEVGVEGAAAVEMGENG
jgi:hypothetical protein